MKQKPVVKKQEEKSGHKLWSEADMQTIQAQEQAVRKTMDYPETSRKLKSDRQNKVTQTTQVWLIPQLVLSVQSVRGVEKTSRLHQCMKVLPVKLECFMASHGGTHSPPGHLKSWACDEMYVTQRQKA